MQRPALWSNSAAADGINTIITGNGIMGAEDWALIVSALLASALPVHALIISARWRRANVKVRIPPDKRGEASALRDEHE